MVDTGSDSRDQLVTGGKYLGAIVIGLLVMILLLVVFGIIGIPDAEMEENRWGDVADEDVEILTDIGIDNPNPFGFGGDADVEYEISLQSVELADGGATGMSVDAGYSVETL